MTTTGKNRIMIYGPKNDGTYVVEFRTAAGEALAILYPRRRSTGDPVGQILACEEIPPALVIVAAAEAADQVSYAEGNGGGSMVVRRKSSAPLALSRIASTASDADSFTCP